MPWNPITEHAIDVWDIAWGRSIALFLPRALLGIHH